MKLRRRGLRYGDVRAREVVAAINGALGIEGDWHDDDERLQPLTRYWEIEDLKKMLGREHGWIEFNLADRMLCLLGLPHLWIGPLSDTYARVNLRETASPYARTRNSPKGRRRCARPGCLRTFDEAGGHVPRSGRTRKRYCSTACRIQDYRHRAGVHRSVDGPGRSFLVSRCRRGHEFTEENTKWRPDGTKTCRTCIRESEARRAERRAA